MSKKYCDNCYYGDSCYCHGSCEYYTPVNEQSADEDINDIIERNRRAFRREWLRYIEEWDN